MSSGSAVPDVPRGSSLSSALRSVYRKRDRLVQKRVNFNVLKRDSVHVRNQNRIAHEAFASSAAQFMSQVEPKQNGFEEYGVLHNAWDGLELSNAERERQEETLRQAAMDINVLEDELMEEEQLLYSELRKSSVLPPPASPDGSCSISGSTWSDRSTQQSQIPPTLRAYYEKRQHATFLHQRLHEFQAGHREEIELRKLNKELDQPIEPPEKLFLERYFGTLVAMYQEFHNTKREARDLRLRCRDLHLKIEDNDDDLSDIEVLEARVVVDKQLIHLAAVNRSKYNGVNPVEDLLFGYTDNTARVNSWLTNLHQQWQRNDSQAPTTYEAPPSDFWTTSPYTKESANTEAISATPTTNIVRSTELSFGTSHRGEIDEWHVDVPFLSRETSFPGERPKHRYSDPAIQQRTGTFEPYLPYSVRNRAWSTN